MKTDKNLQSQFLIPKKSKTFFRKIILFLVLSTSLFLITGCTEQPTKVSGGSAYKGGTLGITGNFEPLGIEENGIYSVFDSETFPLDFTISNKGEYKIKPEDVTVKLLGPSKEEFSGIPAWEVKNKNDIEIISDLLPTGGEETLSFAADAKYLKPVSGAIEREWFANIEYKYQTYIIIPEVCLKEDLKDTRVCEVKGTKNFFVSGAPISVSAVTEDLSGQGIMAITLNVKNSGTGKVAKPTENFGTQDKFIYSIDDAGWECKSGGTIGEGRFNVGEAQILCKTKQPLAKGTLATKQLKVTLDYKYRDIISEKLMIKESTN
jgi:hypothetical protein